MAKRIKVIFNHCLEKPIFLEDKFGIKPDLELVQAELTWLGRITPDMSHARVLRVDDLFTTQEKEFRRYQRKSRPCLGHGFVSQADADWSYYFKSLSPEGQKLASARKMRDPKGELMKEQQRLLDAAYKE